MSVEEVRLTCVLECAGCGIATPYHDRVLAEQAAEIHQCKGDYHVTRIRPYGEGDDDSEIRTDGGGDELVAICEALEAGVHDCTGPVADDVAVLLLTLGWLVLIALGIAVVIASVLGWSP